MQIALQRVPLCNTISFIALQDGIHLSMMQQIFTAFFFLERQRKIKDSSDCLGFHQTDDIPGSLQQREERAPRRSGGIEEELPFILVFFFSSEYFIPAAAALDMKEHTVT